MKQKKHWQKNEVNVMSHKKGFSLVSFLVYLMLFSLIMLFACHIITALIVPSSAALRKCQSLIGLHIATDLFVRDIRSMRTADYQWKITTPHELIWEQNGRDIGWCFCDNRLERREGLYNKGWKNSTLSTIARGIESTFSHDKRFDSIVGIELILKPQWNKKKEVACYVSLNKAEI
jgi:type II secretory pathway component PulJ